MPSTTFPGRALPAWPALVIAGALIWTIFCIALVQRPLAVALLLVGLLVLLPALVLEDSTPYWLTLFLVGAHLGVGKSLLDGLTVLEKLRIDYGPFVFVPEIRAGDLPLLVLLLFWINDLRLGRGRFYLPAVGWLALGFLGWSALGLLRAPSRYMALVEFARQAKFVLIFFYAANNLGSKRMVRWVWLLVLFMVFFQGGVTIFRFVFNFYDSFFGDLFGRSILVRGEHADLTLASEGWLGGLRNSFGTTMSGAVTSQLLLLGLPCAVFAALRNPLFPRGIARVIPFCVGLTALLLTLSRSSVLSGAVTLALCYVVAMRRGYLPRRVALFVGLATIVAAAAATPFVPAFLTRHPENVEVRFEQYRTGASMIHAHPLLGVGLNNSTGEAPRYSRYSYSLIDVHNRTAETPIHSFPVTLLVEVGLIGGVLYASFFAGIAATASRPARTDPDDACSALAFLIGLIGLGVGVLTNPLFDDGVQTFQWLFAGAIVAIAHRIAVVHPVATAAPGLIRAT